MLGADVAVLQAFGFLHGELKNALRLGTEGDLDRGRDPLLKHRTAFDVASNILEGDARALEDPARDSFAVTQQPQQEMLGLDREMAELAGLVPGEKERAPGCLCVSFEHLFVIVTVCAMPRRGPRARRRLAGTAG